MRNVKSAGARRHLLSGNVFRTTALAAALLGVYGTAYSADPTIIVNNTGATQNIGSGPYSGVTVNSGGVATGTGTTVTGALYDLNLVNAGGSLTLTNATITNTIFPSGGPNGRAVTVTGLNANATLNDSTIILDGSNGPSGGHAFTAGVGTVNGGHATIDGGTITATGSKRTVGIQANDGGSIDASNVTINTYSTFGHAVNAYRTVTLPETSTLVKLNNVTINTYDPNYADGIQSANKGARVEATDTNITTVGTNSFGAEVFNGATASLTGGSITTSGTTAVGVRVYGGSLGAGSVAVDGTRIMTSGAGAVGVSAGDLAEPTQGIVALTGAGITTTGDGANGVQANYGSAITSANSTIAVSGVGSSGVWVGGGASATLNGDSVSSVGNDTGNGLYATGVGSSIGATDVSVAVQRARDASAQIPLSVGVWAVKGATATLTRGSVTTANDWNVGLLSQQHGSHITATGTAIQTNGLAATGVESWVATTDTTPAASNTLIGGSVTTLGNESYGLLAQNLGSTINASGLAVTTSGSQSFGVNAYNGGVATLTNVDVKTSGAGAHGVVMGTMSPTMRPGSTSGGSVPTMASTVDMTGGSITTTGAGSSGMYLEDSGTVNLTGVKVQSSGASITSQLTQAGQTQNITAGSGTTMTRNNGTLLQVNRTTAGMDGTVNLTLAAGSTSTGDVVDLDGLTVGGSDTRTGGGKTNFTVANGASWTGIVRGINDTTAGDGASIHDTGGAPIAGNVSTGSNATVTFANGANIGGGVSTGVGTQGSFTGDTSIGGSVTGNGSTLNFNGPTTIGQGLSTQGSAVTFSNTTNVAQSVNSGAGSTVAFNGATTIGQNLTGGSGSSINFAGPTTISQNVSGNGANIHFSQGQPTTIGGNVTLSNNSVLRGGAPNTPIAITGDTNVNSGATLGGDLFVSGSPSGSGGTYSPGNSVGTQSYDTQGSFTGTFDMEVNAAGKSDLIIIRNGNLDLTGKNLIVGQEIVEGGTLADGGYVLNHAYTIVQTPNGNVVNKFDSQALNSSFANTLVTLDPVQYDPQDVKISLSLDPGKVANKRAGLSANQNATLDGVISVAGQNASAGAALVSTDTQGALNQLSGEAYASTQSALINANGLVQRVVSNRLRGNLGAGTMAGAPTAQASGAALAGSMPQSAAHPLWAQVVGNWNSLKDDGNAARTRTSLGGLFVGGDAAVGKGWRVGGALGFTDGNINVDDRSSTSSVRSYTGTIYGGNSWAVGKGSVNFLAGAAYTHNDVDARRAVYVGGSQVLKSSYNVNAAQLFTELGYSLPVGRASSVEPYLGVAWMNQRADAFGESGGSAALMGDSQRNNVTSTTLGLRGKTVLDMGSKQATLMGGLGWRHANGDIEASRQVAFVQGNGASFSVAGTPIAKNAAVVDLSAEMAVGKNATMGLSYSGQFGNNSNDNAGSLYLKVRF